MKASPRVLVVDDDDGVLTFVPMILRSEGFEVDVASGASEAVFAVGENPPEAVVLDYSLPEEDGASVASTLRRLVPGVRILGFSAVVRDGAGWADAFVTKDDVKGIVPALWRLLGVGA